MKMTQLGLILALGASTVAGIFCPSAARAQGIDIQKNIVPTHVFTPTGFDSNDQVEFVIQGYYPSTCYHTTGLSYKVDQQNKTIVVSNQAEYSVSGICASMLVFYQRTVQVGVLNKGVYSIQFESDSGVARSEAKLNVAQATGPNVDEFLYAPVQAAAVRFDKTRGTILTLSGQYTNSCASYKDTKIIQNQPDVIEVLPIMEFAKRSDCKEMHLPFHVDIPLKSKSKGETLVHIRSLNGQAVNVVHYFDTAGATSTSAQ